MRSVVVSSWQLFRNSEARCLQQADAVLSGSCRSFDKDRTVVGFLKVTEERDTRRWIAVKKVPSSLPNPKHRSKNAEDQEAELWCNPPSVTKREKNVLCSLIDQRSSPFWVRKNIVRLLQILAFPPTAGVSFLQFLLLTSRSEVYFNGKRFVRLVL